MSHDIINGSVPSLAACTMVAPRVPTSRQKMDQTGYMYSIMCECQRDTICKTVVEVRDHVDSYSLAGVLNPRDALYGGPCETFALHDQSTDRSVIKYVDIQSIYPYICKSKHYPVCHIRCSNRVPPRGLRIPLLPCHINGKVMFVLCRACAETTNGGVCGHTRSERCLTGTWVSVE